MDEIPSLSGLVAQALQMVLVLAVAPLFLGLTRKVRAALLGRRGPGVLQPYRDLSRLVRKEVVLAHNASWLFRATPYLVFAATWVAAALIPTFAVGLPFAWAVDLIAVVGLLATARFFLTLAGLDVGTAFGGIGASREVMIASLAEPAFITVVFTVALVAGSTNLSTISAFIDGSAVGLRVSLAMALVSLMMIGIAENGRIPIDNPATHLELTMIHEAMVLEYSGRHLAMIELAQALKLIVYVSLIGSIFAPWGITTAGQGFSAYATSIVLYLGKVTFAAAALALFETLTAKMRVFRAPEFLGAALMLGLLATLLLFVSRSF